MRDFRPNKIDSLEILKNDIDSMVEQVRQKKKRCAICRAHLALIAYACKCEKEFCVNHLSAAEHDCSFNYRVQSHTQLSKQLDISGLVQKIEKI
jgi:hypothetical protein